MSIPAFSTRTSGDLIADRRYAYAEAALAEADFTAARDLFEQAVERAPDWPPGHLALAKACLALGEGAAAGAALHRVRALDPEDRLGAGVLLARLAGGEAMPGAMPDAYVASLFDEYAPRFDTHLTGALNYRAPEQLGAMLKAARPKPPWLMPAQIGHVLDLGCGTGLMAAALGDTGARLTGVDLSPAMVRLARSGGRYVRLECAELLAFLGREPAQAYDAVLAADVFCYVPDLAPVFVEVARVLRSGGLFAFSIQTHPGEGVVIGEDIRVHHAPARIRHWAAAGFSHRAEAAVSTREDRGQPVPGALFLLSRHPI